MRYSSIFLVQLVLFLLSFSVWFATLLQYIFAHNKPIKKPSPPFLLHVSLVIHNPSQICPNFCTFLIIFPLVSWTNPTIIFVSNHPWWTSDTLTHPFSLSLPFPTIFSPLKPLKQPSAPSYRSSCTSPIASCRISCKWLFEVRLQRKPP